MGLVLSSENVIGEVALALWIHYRTVGCHVSVWHNSGENVSFNYFRYSGIRYIRLIKQYWKPLSLYHSIYMLYYTPLNWIRKGNEERKIGVEKKIHMVNACDRTVWWCWVIIMQVVTMLVDRADDKGQCIILIKKQNAKECVSLAGVSLITYLYGPVGEGMLTFNIHTKICTQICTYTNVCCFSVQGILCCRTSTIRANKTYFSLVLLSVLNMNKNTMCHKLMARNIGLFSCPHGLHKNIAYNMTIVLIHKQRQWTGSL